MPGKHQTLLRNYCISSSLNRRTHHINCPFGDQPQEVHSQMWSSSLYLLFLSFGFCLAVLGLNWGVWAQLLLGMWDLSSLTKDQTRVLCIGKWILFFFFLVLPVYCYQPISPPPSCTHAQSCNPMDFSPPDSSVHGFFQARILEWVGKVDS